VNAANVRGTHMTLAAGSTRGARLAGAGIAGAGLASAAHGALWHNASLNGARWNHRGDWWRRRPFFGWAGPVFWPWFYDDFFYYTVWDLRPVYGDPFRGLGLGRHFGRDVLAFRLGRSRRRGAAAFGGPQFRRARQGVGPEKSIATAEPVERHVRGRRP